MKKAIVRIVFSMPNAWGEADVIETGLAPLEGVSAFLNDEGLADALSVLAAQFGMDFRHLRVEIHEQEEA